MSSVCLHWKWNHCFPLTARPVSQVQQHAILASPPLSHTAARLALASTPWRTAVSLAPPVKKTDTAWSFWASPNGTIYYTAAAFSQYFEVKRVFPAKQASFFNVAPSSPSLTLPSLPLYIPASSGSQHLLFSPLACPPPLTAGYTGAKHTHTHTDIRGYGYAVSPSSLLMTVHAG